MDGYCRWVIAYSKPSFVNSFRQAALLSIFSLILKSTLQLWVEAWGLGESDAGVGGVGETFGRYLIRAVVVVVVWRSLAMD